MDGNGRKIEVFAPFGAAFDLTKLILFQPFDIRKWLAIGFAAFLAMLGGSGGGNGFNFNPGKGDWNFRSTTRDGMGFGEGIPAWLIPLLIFGVLLVIALIILFAWVGSRGRFMFMDCIVRNRGAIVEPWNEFKREGNSFCLFWLGGGVILLAIGAVASAPIWVPVLLDRETPEGMVLVLELVGAGLLMVALLVAWSLVTGFMVPVMYRQRCRAWEAMQAVLRAIAASPVAVILYALFRLVLAVAIAMAACVVTCATCCLAAIPYVGTVILLPLHVLMMSYLLLFVRQFGPEFDAWGNLSVAPAAPPVQELPPPPEEPPLAGPPPLPA